MGNSKFVYPSEHTSQYSDVRGMSTREFFAKEVMRVLVDGWNVYHLSTNSEGKCDLIAKAAVQVADALIRELNKK